MKAACQKFPCVLGNVLIIVSNTTSLSFGLKMIGTLAATIVAIFYLLVLYLLVTTKTHKYVPFSACTETLLKSTCQHLLLLVGFDTLTYRMDYDRSPMLVGHQGEPMLMHRPYLDKCILVIKSPASFHYCKNVIKITI